MGALSALLRQGIRTGKKILYHTTDAKKGIEGELKTGSDLGFHLGDTPEISRNAAIKSNKSVKDLKTENFELDVKPEEILTINRRGGHFEPELFADQLLEAKAITKKEQGMLYNKIDEIGEEVGYNEEEYYSELNKVYKKLLKEKNIKAIKYFNEFDAGINPLFMEAMAKADVNPILALEAISKGKKNKYERLKDLDLTDTGIDVKPADSYVIFDSSVIKKIPEKKEGGRVMRDPNKNYNAQRFI